MIHERGSLWKAIRASASIPGVFVPVLSDGNILVDGGLVNNLPGDVMRERDLPDADRGRRRIGARIHLQAAWSFLRPGSFFAAASCRSQRESKSRTSLTYSSATTDVPAARRRATSKENADVCLRPPIDAYGVLQFESLDEIAEVGYRYAKGERWKNYGGEIAGGDVPGDLRPA